MKTSAVSADTDALESYVAKSRTHSRRILDIDHRLTNQRAGVRSSLASICLADQSWERFGRRSDLCSMVWSIDQSVRFVEEIVVDLNRVDSVQISLHCSSEGEVLAGRLPPPGDRLPNCLLADLGGGSGSAWEGAAYARLFLAEHEKTVSEQTWSGFPPFDQFRDSERFKAELSYIAQRVAADEETALAFFNELGVEATADLPTFALAISESDVGVARDGGAILDDLAEGLAAATRRGREPDAPPLAFSGADLMNVRVLYPATDRATVSPAAYFGDRRTGRQAMFDPHFAAEATTEILNLGARGYEQWLHGYLGFEMQDLSEHPTGVAGDDPRESVLAWWAAHPERLDLLFDRIGQTSGDLSVLLRPEHALPDRLAIESGSGLAEPPAIVAFLGVVSQQPNLAARVIHDVVEARNLVGRGVGDIQTAVGLDLVLAGNATIMIPDSDLAAVGLVDDGLKTAALAVTPDVWRQAVDVVLDHAVGIALVGRLTSIFAEAVSATFQSVHGFDGASVAKFAHLVGRVQVDVIAGVLAYAAKMDESTEARNRLIATVGGMAIGALGFLPIPVLGSVAVWTAGGAFSYWYQGDPADLQLLATEGYLKAEMMADDQTAVAETVVGAELGLGGNSVTGPAMVGVQVRDDDGQLSPRWVGPSSDGWFWWSTPEGREPMPRPDDGEFHNRYDPERLAKVQVAVAHLTENINDGRWSSAYLSGDHTGHKLADATEDTAWMNEWLGPRSVAD